MGFRVEGMKGLFGKVGIYRRREFRWIETAGEGKTVSTYLEMGRLIKVITLIRQWVVSDTPWNLF
jgi:hypothetical protein